MKKRNAFRALTIRLVLIGLICLCVDKHVRADDIVKFNLVQDHWIVIPVFVNSKGPFAFLLDTGANVTMITPELAQMLAIRPTARVSLITVAGSQIVPYTVLPSMSLGSQTVENLEVIHNELSEMRSLESNISGVLGQNFLSQFNYTLNYHDRLFEFGEGQYNKHPVGSRIQLQQSEGRLIITSQTTSSKKKVLKLVLDSGVSRLIIFETTSESLELDLEPSENKWITGSTPGGSSNMRAGYLRQLQIGRAKFSKLPVALVKAPGTRDNFGDGLLPTSLFRSIFFNNKKGYVIVNAQPVKPVF